MSRTFDDMHLVWIGLASTAATFLCGAVALGMLHFASPEREDSLRALITVMAAPSGSNLNPASIDGLMIRAPSVPEDGIVKASLERSGARGELMLAFAAVITREGNISGLEELGDDRGRLQVAQLINEISRGRLEPARYGTDPIAVNLVWLVEHITVKPKAAAAGGLRRGGSRTARRRGRLLEPLAYLLISATARRDVVHRVGHADDDAARGARRRRSRPRTPRAASPGSRPSGRRRASGSRRASTRRAAPPTARRGPRRSPSARAPVRVADCTSTTGGVLSMSKLTLSSSPTSAVAGEFDGASDAATFTK